MGLYNMNIYLIKDRANNNYYINGHKWTSRPNKARLITSVHEARQRRSKIKGIGIRNAETPKKLDIVEFELVEKRVL